MAALAKAALLQFPHLGSEHPTNQRTSYQQYPSKFGKRFGGRKPFAHRGGGKGGGKRAHRGHEVDDGADDDQEEEEEEENVYNVCDGDVPGLCSSESEGPDRDVEDGGQGDESEEEMTQMPPELEQAIAESEAYLTRAKKGRAEVEKARGFFKKGSPHKGKDEALKPLKAKLPCSECGALHYERSA